MCTEVLTHATQTLHLNQDDSTQPDGATGGRDPKYNFEFQRLFTYPDNLNFDFKSLVAKCGFYFESDIARCQFCNLELSPVTPDKEVNPHDCDKADNVPLPENTSDYRFELNRVLSFLRRNWPKQANDTIHVGALDLAHWGFYYTGDADAARCHFCRLEVRGWERGDTAQSEHRRWNPHCPFVSNRAVGNVRLGEERVAENVQSDAAVQPRSLQITELNQNHRNSELGILKHTPARHPEYASMSSRLGSFNSWPLSLSQRPQQLAEAGLYYTGKGDRVICFQCGGGLKDWGRTDQPWVEHAVWFPRCSYLNIQKGTNFIQQVQRLKQEADQPFSDISPSSSIRSDSSSSIVRPEPASFRPQPAVETQTPEVPTERQCKICLEKELGIVFLPCGHMAACVDCAPQLKNCPLCRANLSAYIRAFLP